MPRLLIHPAVFKAAFLAFGFAFDVDTVDGSEAGRALANPEKGCNTIAIRTHRHFVKTRFCFIIVSVLYSYQSPTASGTYRIGRLCSSNCQTNEDLNALFQFQLDEEANYLAAFTSKDSKDKTAYAYIEKYSKFLSDPTINMRTIKANDEIVGSIAKFVMENDAEITYWIDRKFWDSRLPY